MTVFLVGAGPGDPGLLTVRGAELLRGADVVVYDRLSVSSLLDLAPPAAERISVGKIPGRATMPQEAINELLVERGRAGQRVVRLKGGDPFLFARGGEEAAALAAAGVPFEVVPGVTSALAVPAYAGIPVTLRHSSTSVTVVTGHEDPNRAGPDGSVDWEAVAHVGGTIVILMGVERWPAIAARLLAAGRPSDTPAAAIQWGTRPEQRSVRATLATLGDHQLEAPSVIVIGDVAGRDLAWFERRPLFGRRVVVTRPRRQAGALVERLVALGAEPVEIPAIEICPPADGGAALERAVGEVAAGRYGTLVFTSANGVERFFAHVPDTRVLGGTRVAAIGRGTAAALAAFRVIPDLVPPEYVAESLLAALGPAPGTAASSSGTEPSGGRLGPGGGRAEPSGGGTQTSGGGTQAKAGENEPGGGHAGATEGGTGAARARRLLLARAAVARDVLPDGLRTAGWEVDVVEAYRTERGEASPAALARAAAADAICFTSSSTVENYLSLAGASAVPPVVVCIGPVTAETARQHGLTVTAVAEPHTIDGLVAALVAATAR